MSRLRPKASSPNRLPLYVRPKPKLPDERKENAYTAERRRASVPEPAPRPPDPAKKQEPDKSKLASKRRNVLAIRKPNSKPQLAGVVKVKLSRRSADEEEPPAAAAAAGSKLSKRSYTRVRRAAPSSSDDLLHGSWEHAPGGTALARPGKRRPPPAAPAAPPPNALKKIRLKTAA